MNRRSFLLLLIALMLCIPIFGILSTIPSTTAQNSNIEITKVARISGNFLEMDFVNHGKSDVSVSVGGFYYFDAPTPPYEIKYNEVSLYFVNDAYHYTVSYENVSTEPWTQFWTPVPAGQTVRCFTQGTLQSVDNWVVYRAQVCENWQFYQLYPDMKVAYIGTGNHDARVPTVLYNDGRHSMGGKHLPFFLGDPQHYELTRGDSSSLVFGLYKFSGGVPQESDLLCGRRLNFYIDDTPAPGVLWYHNSSSCVVASGGLSISPQDTATLSPGMHMFTAEFLGDSTYGPSSCKLIFKVG